MTTAMTETTSKINSVMVKGGKIIMQHACWCNFLCEIFKFEALSTLCQPTAENLSSSTCV